MTLLDSLRATVNNVRSIPGILGLRPYTVTVHVRSWSGTHIGDGTKTDSNFPIKVAGNKDPKVQRLSSKDIIASSGLYQDQDIEVIFTPDYYLDGYGGIEVNIFDPSISNAEVHYTVTGPDFPNGATFKKVSHNVSELLTYRLILRKTGQTL